MRRLLPLTLAFGITGCAWLSGEGPKPTRPEKSRAVTIRGVAQRSCPRYELARGVVMQLVDSQGTVLAEDTTGPDGTFVLWPEARSVYANQLYVQGGTAKQLVPDQERLFSKECTTFHKCVVQMSTDVGCPSTLPVADIQPASAVKPAPEEEPAVTGKKPSSKLLPQGYMTP